MSGSVPPLDPGPTPGRSRIGWWWLLVALLAVGLVTALVAQPWAPVETEPSVTPTVTSPTPEPSSAPSSASPSVTVPGADAVFDATTAPALFVTTDDLLAEIPAADPEVRLQIPSGQLSWGLPIGSTIDPPECLVAATVVAMPPPWYDTLLWGNDALSFQQEVVLLADPAAAREAFRALVTTVDACPEYSQVNPDIDGATWTAEPAIEGQGVFPSIVQEVTHSAEGSDVPGYRGHLLVGNTIVTWTAEALTTGDRDAALATLGDPADLSAMVQERAQEAVRALG
ncbi:sensor domain-containing protein [Cellulomonas sp. Root137]|uniref:sensor domain-containing protein n=1 Tax=Cellulomonas sp. Root137 TaxID=1736459 RepID=UPI0006FB64D8|nr:sensor domain-containing protein [Cellulomonas sp. Root137]KQY41947.1 hypothetical protein ASD18_20170 [Cellulomonas sp. Root137]KRD41228.1 hypothetical protein ASE38_16535 [Cellulomonas sp. Root930]